MLLPLFSYQLCLYCAKSKIKNESIDLLTVIEKKDSFRDANSTITTLDKKVLGTNIIQLGLNSY